MRRFRVQAERRLVEDDHFGLLEKQFREAQALAHAVREGSYWIVEHFRAEAHSRRGFLDAAVELGVREGSYWIVEHFRAEAHSRRGFLDAAVELGARDLIELTDVGEVLTRGQLLIEAHRIRQVANACLDRALTLSGSLAGSRPRTSTRPLVGSVRPRSIRIVVVLPDPLGPRMPKTSPSWTRRFRSTTAGVSPYCFDRFSVRMIVFIGPLATSEA